MESLIETFVIYGTPLAFVMIGMVVYFEWQDYRAARRKAQEKTLKKARKKEKKRLNELVST